MSNFAADILPGDRFSIAFIALGSNLDNPTMQIETGLEAIRALPESGELICAPWYQSKAIGPGEQPDYINTVARLQTYLRPLALLRALQAIENQQGRQRSVRWGARTLDLDLLLFNNECYRHPDLQLPHPEMNSRAFVLIPLHDLQPQLVFPDGSKLIDKLKNCVTDDLIKMRHKSA